MDTQWYYCESCYKAQSFEGIPDLEKNGWAWTEDGIFCDKCYAAYKKNQAPEAYQHSHYGADEYMQEHHPTEYV